MGSAGFCQACCALWFPRPGEECLCMCGAPPIGGWGGMPMGGMPGMPIGGMPIGGMPMGGIPGIPMGGIPGMPMGGLIMGIPCMPIGGMPIIGFSWPCEYLQRSPRLQSPRLKSPHISFPKGSYEIPEPPWPPPGGSIMPGRGASFTGADGMAGLKSCENLQWFPRLHSPRV